MEEIQSTAGAIPVRNEKGKNKLFINLLTMPCTAVNFIVLFFR